MDKKEFLNRKFNKTGYHENIFFQGGKTGENSIVFTIVRNLITKDHE